MIHKKSKEEIRLMSRAGEIASFALRQIMREIRPGITTLELDKIAKRVISAREAECAFWGYKGYKHNLCVSINDEVVHGLPSARRIKEGDIVSIDLGVKYKGYFADTAISVIVGKGSDEAKRLVSGVRRALKEAISILKPGIKVGDIENITGRILKEAGLSPVTALSGHGIGREIHEEPSIRTDGSPNQGEKIEKGMVFAIEPMATTGTGEVFLAKDGWTVKSKDGSPAAHFEHTVLVTEQDARILTLRR